MGQENPRVPTSPGLDYDELFRSVFDWELYCDSTRPSSDQTSSTSSSPCTSSLGRNSHRDLPSLITEIQPFLDHLSLDRDGSGYLTMTPGLSPDHGERTSSESMGQTPPELIRGGSTSPSDHSGSVFLDAADEGPYRRRPQVSLEEFQAQDDKWTYPQAIPSKHTPGATHLASRFASRHPAGVRPPRRRRHPASSGRDGRRPEEWGLSAVPHLQDPHVWSPNPAEERRCVDDPRFPTAKPRDILIFFTREPDAPYLRASVQAYHSQNGLDENPRNAAFERDRFPSYAELQRWVEAQIKRERSTHFEHAVQNFLLSYSEGGYDLPKHKLVSKVHTMNCFFRIWKAPPFTCCSSSNKFSHVPFTVQAELRRIAWKALVSHEHDILKLLEECLAQQEPLKPRERMAVWASLWQLMLMYRELVIAHDNFFMRNPSATRDPAVAMPYDTLYNVFFPLIAIFYHCQFKTPKRLEMSMDWLKESANPTGSSRIAKIHQFSKDMMNARKGFYEGIQRSPHKIDERLSLLVVSHELKKLSTKRRSKPAGKSKGGSCDDG
ncbi:hypothetical protein MRS44_000956 [Fusarium solani]|uniref:uncharacterized protein n=1 Tax=Fusarium solani TaxID=169388 RepID=UPI0032C3EE39|nr:hypothetical protein MRS44_000956 [Fusarium solani]